MGFLKLLFGFWASWTLIKVATQFVQMQLSKNTNNEVSNQNDGKTLELLPCPYCGVFTTTPCTNPDCPGRGI